jgi:hypothetical protein
MTVGRRTDGDVRYDRSPGLGPGLGLTVTTHCRPEVCGRRHLKGLLGHLGAGCVVGLAVPPLPALKYAML